MTLKDETKKRLVLIKTKLNEAFEEVTEKLKTNLDKSRIKGLDTSPSGLIQAENSIKALEQLKSSMISGSINFVSSMVLKRYTTEFGFVTDPQLKAAANSMGGYYDILASGIRSQEQLMQQYRVMALNSTLNIAGSIAHLALHGRIMPAAASILTRLGAGNLVARAASAALASKKILAILGLGFASAKFTFGLSIAAAAIYAGYQGLQLFFNSKKLKEETEMANTAALMQFYNPSSVLNVYNNNAFLLGTEIQKTGDTTGRLRTLIGTEFGDTLAGDEVETENFSLASRVYQSAYTNDFSNFSTGVDLRGFGFSSSKILAVASNFERKLQTGYNEDLIANVLFISGSLTGGDTRRMEQIMENIVRAHAFTEADVSEASEKFEEFFAAIVGDGKPQAAHLKILSTLSDFSLNYAMGIKANLDSTTEVAKIFQFMSEDGSINERFDASPVKNLIKSVDDLLFKGATYTNLGAVSLLDSLDISRAEAIRGVTSNADIFQRFISGLFDYMNVNNNDVLNQTNDFDVALQNFSLKHGLSSEALNALTVAMRRRAGGENIEDIRKEYISNIESSINSNLNNLNRGLDGAASFFEILTNITHSADKLVATTEKNIAVISSIQSMTQAIVLEGFGTFADAFVNVFNGILGLETLSQALESRYARGEVSAYEHRAHVSAGTAPGTATAPGAPGAPGTATAAAAIGTAYGATGTASGSTGTASGAPIAADAATSATAGVTAGAATGAPIPAAASSAMAASSPVTTSVPEVDMSSALSASRFTLSLPLPFTVAAATGGAIYGFLTGSPSQSTAAASDGVSVGVGLDIVELDKFKIALAFTKKVEGGLSMNPNDPGNWTGGRVDSGELKGTNFGISAAAYPNLDIKNLTIEQAEAIYKRDYWDTINGDSIPFPASTAVFDFAVNSGPSRALRFWREIKSEYEGKSDVEALNAFQNKRRDFFRGLSTYDTFGSGWENRLNSLDEELRSYLPGYSTGGSVLGFNNTSNVQKSGNNINPKNMHITIPIMSLNPSSTAKKFSEHMSNLIGF